MKTILRLSLATLLALPLAASAEWEGVLDMKITGKDMSGSSKAFVGAAGARMQMEMAKAGLPESAGGGIKMVVVTRTAEPGISYMINDAQKTYARVDVKELQKKLPKSETEKKWTVKRLGPDSVAGFGCEKALVAQEGGTSENEVCISKEILGPASMFGSGQRGASGHALETALKANGLQGMPIRMILREKGKAEATMTWELVKAEKRPLPASTFEVPAGYKETSMMGTMLSPEQARQMEDAMKNLTPEQRKMMEEMMKKKGGGQ